MRKSALRLCSINVAADALDLKVGAALADVRAILPDLAYVMEQPERDRAFLYALARWAVQYTPWITRDESDGLFLDITGTAHLFNGEAAMLNRIIGQLCDFGLTVRASAADTKGAAWALARFASQSVIAPKGRTREAVTSLPVAALRIDDDVVVALNRLGLRVIGDIAGMQRRVLTRRFGETLVQRLDQMFGAEFEPISPCARTPPYAVRLSLPEPIGKTEDVTAALLRLLIRLCERLERDQRGARQMRLSIQRTDHSEQAVEIGLARASRDPMRIARLFDHAIDGLDAGFGIDAVRLYASVTETLEPKQDTHSSGQDQVSRPSGQDQVSRQDRNEDALNDLIARLGNRIGFDRVTRFLPAESHVPEHAVTVAAAAYSQPEEFPENGPCRPIILFTPERITPIEDQNPPDTFRWRGVSFDTHHATGPERIAPQWWWDDPNWRSGPRDYWRVQTAQGRRLWLFYAHGSTQPYDGMPPGWFTHGEFA